MSARYLILAPEYAPSVGGVQRYLAGLAKALGPDAATVLAPGHPEDREHDDRSPVPVERVAGSRGLLWPVAWYRAALRSLARRPATALVAGHIRLAPVAWALARRTGLPLVCLAYGMDVTAGRFGRLKRSLWRSASRVVAISRFTADRVIEQGVHPSRVALLPPGLDPGEVPPARSGDAAAARRARGLGPGPILLTVSRLAASERYKGHELVFDAVARLGPRFPGLVHVVVGEGDDRPRLEAEALRRGVAGRVRFAGRQSDADLADWYRLADVFVMPSGVLRDREGLKFEGFGIVYLEAAAAGLPVVAARAGGAVDAVVDGATGLLVDPGDPDGRAAALESILSDPPLARTFGRAGRERALRDFLWHRLPVRERLGP